MEYEKMIIEKKENSIFKNSLKINYAKANDFIVLYPASPSGVNP